LKTAVVADSACAPSAGVLQSLEISIVPNSILLEGKMLRDGIDLEPEELYRRLPALENLPTTAAPPAERFFEVFTDLLQQANEIICFTVASSLSNTNASARQALSGFSTAEKQRIHLIDTQNAGAAAGVIVSEAARMAKTGCRNGEILKQAYRMIPNSKLIATLETLEYLKRSGRVNRLAALAGDYFNLKPVFYLNQGKVTPLARPRGKRQAFNFILDEFSRDTAGATRIWCTVTHANALEESRLLLQGVRSIRPEAVTDIVPFTVAMGVHTGPGLVGMGYTCIS
jgi:DegV family protein with EDD domain